MTEANTINRFEYLIEHMGGGYDQRIAYTLATRSLELSIAFMEQVLADRVEISAMRLMRHNAILDNYRHKYNGH